MANAFAEIAKHDCGKNKQHHAVIAGETVLRRIFCWNMQQLTDAINIGEKSVGLERLTGIIAVAS
jgi:hypothetical protein